MDAFTIIVITVVAAAAAFIFYKVQYTKKNGIEADAVVSRIEEENHVDSDGSSTSYNYFVKGIICKVESVTGEDGEEDEEFVLVEDEELAGKLIEIANTRIADDEEE